MRRADLSRRTVLTQSTALSLMAMAAGPLRAADPEVVVFAAASLQDVLDDAAPILARTHGLRMTTVIGGSSLLARQVASGAPADVVMLANVDWMAWLVGQSAIQAASVRDLARNRLVVVGPKGSASAPDLRQALLGQGRIATALTAEVPAGIYAHQALSQAGLWDSLHPQIVETDHVRAALALVAIGAVPRGIVYASDALAEERVTVLAAIDPTLHEPIRLTGGLTPAATTQGQTMLDWLASPQGQAVFAAQGFAPIAP